MWANDPWSTGSISHKYYPYYHLLTTVVPFYLSPSLIHDLKTLPSPNLILPEAVADIYSRKVLNSLTNSEIIIDQVIHYQLYVLNL